MVRRQFCRPRARLSARGAALSTRVDELGVPNPSPDKMSDLSACSPRREIFRNQIVSPICRWVFRNHVSSHRLRRGGVRGLEAWQGAPWFVSLQGYAVRSASQRAGQPASRPAVSLNPRARASKPAGVPPCRLALSLGYLFLPVSCQTVRVDPPRFRSQHLGSQLQNAAANRQAS